MYDIVAGQANEQTVAESVSANAATKPDVEMTDLSKSDAKKTNTTSPTFNDEGIHQAKFIPARNITSNNENASSLANPCLICAKEEKRLACLPCGHLVTCSSCGQSVRSCPICHRGIDAFVRIYL